MTVLQERAENFLKRPIPAELKPNYVPDSMTDILLAYYVTHGTLDEEGHELVQICSIEVENEADRHKTEDAKRYFQDCTEILNAMLVEVQTRE